MKMKRMAVLVLVLAVIGLMASGCGPKQRTEAMTEREEYIFGTLVSVKLYAPAADSVFQEVFDDLRDVENRMTVKGLTSELIAVNAAAGREPVKVSEDTFMVIEAAKRYAEASQGAFDPTVLPLVELWGIGTEAARVPKAGEIASTLELVDYNNLVLDSEARTVFLTTPGMGLDLGGIAKGYAADRTAEKLRAQGITRGIINLGGNIYALGAKGDGSPWKIGIQNPVSDRGDYIGIVAVTDQTVVTSGVYERFYEEAGQRYHHILDTDTGHPAENELTGVSILADTSMDADALSTACFVLGTEKALAFAETLPGVDVLLISRDKQVRMTAGFKQAFTLTDASFTLVE